MKKNVLLVATFLTALVPLGSAMAQSAQTTTPPGQKPAPRRTPSVAPAPARSSASASRAAVVRRPVAHPVASDEQVIVTGTRDPHQHARDSVSPVVVISGAQLRATGQADLRDALTMLVPSLTHQTVGTGTANTIDSINLRGLTSNQTLILVNGKRRHPTSTVYYAPGPQQGTTPVDIDMIPTSEIDHIEVLEDGAAAQYGSDAIAGVVNVILTRRKHGVQFHADNGGYYKGDGFTSRESINGATELPNGGFFNIGAEVKFQDHAVRGGYDNRTKVVDNPIISIPRELQEVIGYNMEYNINDTLKLYSFSTDSHKNADALQNYRTGTNVSGATFPTLYPNGYVPIIENAENDYSVTLGFKGDTFLGFDFDASTTYGGNHNDVEIANTGSQSYLSTYGYTPTQFHQTAYTDTQWTNNLDLRRSFHTPVLAGPINFAIGAEYRYESYKIGAGDYNAYYISGAQGQHAIPPGLASTSNRDVTAGYTDVSTKIIKNWQVDLAGRFEHYTDVGNTEIGKVSSRYDVNKMLAFRGTISSGFRAPTLAEEHFSSLTESPTSASGVLAVDSPGGRILGARPLKPERSTSFSAGILLNPVRSMHLSLDAYQIDIRDRIVVGGVYSGTNAIAAMEASGLYFPSTSATATAQYETNGASTRTRGMDITGTYFTDLGRYGHINWDVAVNFNQTNIRSIARDLNGNPELNAQQQSFLTSYMPRNKEIFGGTWVWKNLDFTVHEIRYGRTTSNNTYWNDVPASMINSVHSFLRWVQSPKFQTNVAIGYNVTPRLHLQLGGNNIGNAYPRKIPYSVQYLGSEIYNTDVQQMGLFGGYYYLQLDYKL
ncbi:TonB-dependent receptor plug domain-containing protein [Tanticharoenia sakaeratensis]|uniref:TonB-dependent receptor plug domain-containing protein n=1 Tax=Tanticharoenia sakaeratensis TaxID=444053 RepID=UPI000662A465|nr:TonB-dependent receptor [Tanticharoenia sakaeratensis]GBQ18722.1 TonB-dependent outer membrane receptor [Tanticharoenia sakaeratensis NBRC 103193]